MLLNNLAISTGMVILTVTIHFFGLAGLIGLMGAKFGERVRNGHILLRTGGLLLVVLALVALHAVEIWAYAGLYVALSAIGDLEEAIYFSASSFATLGAPDVQLGPDHRLIGAIEGVDGFLLIGLSTAFLVGVMDRLGLLETLLMERKIRAGHPRDDQRS